MKREYQQADAGLRFDVPIPTLRFDSPELSDQKHRFVECGHLFCAQHCAKCWPLVMNATDMVLLFKRQFRGGDRQ